MTAALWIDAFASVVTINKTITVPGSILLHSTTDLVCKHNCHLGARVACKGLRNLEVSKDDFALSIVTGLDKFVLA